MHQGMELLLDPFALMTNAKKCFALHICIGFPRCDDKVWCHPRNLYINKMDPRDACVLLLENQVDPSTMSSFNICLRESIYYKRVTHFYLLNQAQLAASDKH